MKGHSTQQVANPWEGTAGLVLVWALPFSLHRSLESRDGVYSSGLCPVENHAPDTVDGRAEC